MSGQRTGDQGGLRTAETTTVPFNRPQRAGAELEYITEAVENLHLSGNGPFSARCSAMLEDLLGTAKVLLTPSGTAALELGVMLLDLEEGDEVIMPSFTFPSTASAVATRGGTPVFVDIREDSLNIDESRVAAAIGPRTRAILPVHYAGVGCQLDVLSRVAEDHGLALLEDAAHAIGSTWDGQALGTFGCLGALSFHETKNVTCGEGGELIINDPDLVEAAQVIQEKGTNRSAFFRGEVDRYTWLRVGSSFVLSDMSAAFLLAQLERLAEITAARTTVWDRYFEGFSEIERRGLVRRPNVPARANHNGHLFYLLLAEGIDRDAVIARARAAGVDLVFHYVPLHSSPAGLRHGRVHGTMERTDRLSASLLRMPLWLGMDEETVQRVISVVESAVLEEAAVEVLRA